MDPSLYRESPSGRLRLRVGLLVDSLVLPRWSAEVVDHILQSGFASVELVMSDSHAGGRSAAPRASFAQRVGKNLTDPDRRKDILYRLYERWDQRNVDPENDPLAPVDCRARLESVPAISVTPIASRFVHRFSVEDIARIRSFDLDVIVRLGFNILRGEILECARYGVWSYHHGDNEHYRGGPAYLWEVVEGNPFSGAVLQVLNERLDAGRVLCKGIFATELGLSRARNRVRPYWGASTFIIQKLRELHVYGWERLEKASIESTSYVGRKAIYRRPTNAEMIRWIVPALGRKFVRRILRKPIVRHWCLATRRGAMPLPAGGVPPDMRGFRNVDSPRGHYYADPFIVREQGSRWIFFEDYDYRTKLGRISCSELLGDGLGVVLPALERPYHLSYPCTFRDGGHWYMIPESVAEETVELYRCESFPDKWQFDRIIMRRRAVDSTIWIEDGVYWLFTTIQDRRGGAGQLWLFYADSLQADWTPHPSGPISTDVRYARGGGAVFRHEGRLFRPSQDGSGRYGRRLFLNEILQLNKENYCEVPAIVVEPELLSGVSGIHSYALLEDTEVIDCQLDLAARKVV